MNHNSKIVLELCTDHITTARGGHLVASAANVETTWLKGRRHRQARGRPADLPTHAVVSSLCWQPAVDDGLLHQSEQIEGEMAAPAIGLPRFSDRPNILGVQLAAICLGASQSLHWLSSCLHDVTATLVGRS